MSDPTTSLWSALWTFVWFAGLGIFSVLSVLVIVFGGYDLAALLTSLRVRHAEAQAAEAEASGPPPSPMAQ
jgi:hypothetical protein